MYRNRIVVALLGLIIIASACTQASSSAPKAPAQSSAGTGATTSKEAGPPVTMKLGAVPDFMLLSPALIGMEKGYFKEANVEVGEIPMGTGTRVMQMLMAKDIDFMDNSSLPALIAIDKGSPLKIVSTIVNGGYFALWVRSDLSDKVKSVPDLKGMKIGTTGPGTGCQTALTDLVKKGGLDPKEAEWVTIPDNSPAAWATAFKSKNVDAGCVWPGTRPAVEDTKLAYPLIDVHDRQVLKKYVGDNLSPIVVVTRQDVIANNPQLVQKRVDVEKKGLQFISSHSAQEVAEIVAPKLKMDVLMGAKITEQQKSNFSPDGRVSRSGIEAEIQIAEGAGLLTKKLKYEDVVDDKFAGSIP